LRAYAHERFSRQVMLTQESVGAYAHAVGDTNPVHHDAELAAATRFGRPIASGTHTTAAL
jgi:3-hydroxybutyryl-CoA dehydratase